MTEPASNKKKQVRDWAKLHQRWYADPVVRIIAQRNPTIVALWPVLVAMAKESSHHRDNPNGVIKITMHDLSGFVFAEPDAIRCTLDDMVDGELVSYTENKLGVMKLQLCRFADWQHATGGAADRKAASRSVAEDEASRENTPACHTMVTDSHTSSQSVPQIEREIEKEKKETISSTSDDSSTGKAVDHCLELFRYWIQATGRNENQLKLSRERRSRVRARLRDGYSVEQIKRAIDGYAASSWHNGDNPAGKRYDTFDLIVRSGEKIEQGIEFANAATQRQQPATNGRRFDADATRRYYLEQGIDPDEVERIIDELEGKQEDDDA